SRPTTDMATTTVGSPTRLATSGSSARTWTGTRAEPSLVPAQWVLGGNLDDDDAHAVGIGDPHLDQPPRLLQGFAHDRHASACQSSMLLLDVAHLQPQAHLTTASTVPVPRDLEETIAQEEHLARAVRVAELAVDRETQHVAVERSATVGVGRAQDDAAGEDVHPR